MCNSVALQIQPPSVANVVCSNAKVIPQCSIGKILPRETPVKQEAISYTTAPSTYSVGKTVSRNSTSTPASASTPQQPQLTITIQELRENHNLTKSKLPFLWKLHILLDDVEATGNDHIVSWLEHGRGFKVYRPKSFIAMIAPFYFQQSKFKSFQRQLHLYEFTRVQYGPEAGSYSHPLFVRGQPDLCLSLSPIKIKGKAGRQHRQAVADAASYGRQPNNAYRTVPSPGKRAMSSTQETISSAVLSKREQEEWVAKIQRMVVKGSTLAAEMRQHQQVQQQEQHQEYGEEKKQHKQPITTVNRAMGGLQVQAIIDDEKDTCSVFGANFHLLPQQEDVRTCEYCCESEAEDDADLDILFLEAE
ncbi:HSF-type DNA-binding protein [Nitzschia inconspicua]|uniref:HSF-type DNA-binding protein n=1 Tax=Nitzschia inconspicua TaxID=303405 RepID=A0A9K3L305_9STRA|nr:HSF-type DNA-binding protein [Nitzschia inconspicua]